MALTLASSAGCIVKIDDMTIDGKIGTTGKTVDQLGFTRKAACLRRFM